MSDNGPPARKRRASARAGGAMIPAPTQRAPVPVQGGAHEVLTPTEVDAYGEAEREPVVDESELSEEPAEEVAASNGASARRAPDDQGAVVITGICGRMGLLLARKLHRQMRVVGIDRRRFDGRPEDIVHHPLDLRRRQTRDIFRAGGIRAVVHLGIMHDLRE
ncbi:MAG TPA: hypothetical protein VHM19_20745, partial [Polyangiales bacterium]|nr:hypothetical protein [Polyangiales bacterium]